MFDTIHIHGTEMKTVEQHVNIIGGIISALVSSGLLAYGFQCCRKYMEHRNRRRILVGLENIRAGKQVMRELLDVSNVTRVMLFNGHDSGGIPDLGRPFYATLIDFVANDEFQIHSEDYENFRVDDSYIEMLLHVMRNGFADIRFVDMRDSVLKRIYSSNNVKHSRLYYLGSLKDRVVYFTVASQIREYTADETIQLDVLADKMRSVFRNRY